MSGTSWMRVSSAAVLAALMVNWCDAQDAPQPMNVVLLVSDDQRWDSLGCAGHPVLKTPHLDRLAGSGVRFTQARVTTSICMTSRASILTGQYMSRHGIRNFGRPLSPEAFAQTYPGLLKSAGYWTGFVGKYGVGRARAEDFDFVRAYEGRHWMQGPDGERMHVTEKNAQDSLAFLKGRPRDQPFCLSVSYFAPHAEDRAPEQYLPQPWSAKYYDNATVPPSPLGDEKHLRALPAFLSQEANEGRKRYHWRFDTPGRYQQSMINYFRLITEVDEAVGRLVGELKAQGVYDNTLILFIGDNGYFHADRGLADKWYPYEESIRVPMIIHDPRLPEPRRGVTRDQMVLNIDLAPTVVAAAGLTVPAVMQGRDLSPLYLDDESPAWRDEFFYEHPTITSKDRIPTSEAVVRRDVKYVVWPEFDHEQLFDLKQDPKELRNLVENPARAELLAEMRRKLKAWRERVR